MKNKKLILFTVLVLGSITDAVFLNPDRTIWVWFQNPSFSAGTVLVGLLVVAILAKLMGTHNKAVYDGTSIINENIRRSQLQPDDYKLDINQGSFNHIPVGVEISDGEIITITEAVPKPPDPVPSYPKRFRENL